MDSIVDTFDDDISELGGLGNELRDVHLILLPEFRNLQHLSIFGHKQQFHIPTYQEMCRRARDEENGVWKMPQITCITVREEPEQNFAPEACVVIENPDGTVFYLAGSDDGPVDYLLEQSGSDQVVGFLDDDEDDESTDSIIEFEVHSDTASPFGASNISEVLEDANNAYDGDLENVSVVESHNAESGIIEVTAPIDDVENSAQAYNDEEDFAEVLDNDDSAEVDDDEEDFTEVYDTEEDFTEVYDTEEDFTEVYYDDFDSSYENNYNDDD